MPGQKQAQPTEQEAEVRQLKAQVKQLEPKRPRVRLSSALLETARAVHVDTRNTVEGDVVLERQVTHLAF